MYKGKFERGKEKQPKRKGPRLGSLIFYSLYFGCILLFWVGVYPVLGWLQGWLVSYEAAQPDTVCQAVFDDLFADPDWGALYDRAGQESGAYESRDTFVAYMEERTENRKLTYMETSAGLSGDRKYLVLLDGETIGAFSLTDHGEEDAQIPDWRLGGLEFHVVGTEACRVRSPGGSRVLVNGRELDNSARIAIRTTQAADYLPVGTSAPEEHTWQVTGLLSAPEITVLDESGNPLPVTFDPQQGIYIAESPQPEIGEAERETALKAVRTYALYMIKQAGAGEIAKYFNTNSDTYRSITKVVLSFVQDAASREFTGESVTDYCRYSENLFSVRVSLNVKLTRSDGSVKDNPIDQTLFFSREEGGKWLCYAMTAVDVSQAREQVRLTFCQGERVLSSEFVDVGAESVQCPQPLVPTGKTFSGWTVEETDESGNTVLRLVFQPDETGNVTLPEGTILTAMTLYPLFE